MNKALVELYELNQKLGEVSADIKHKVDIFEAEVRKKAEWRLSMCAGTI